MPEGRAEYRRAAEDAIERVPMDAEQKELFLGLLDKLERDDEALLALKGHLVIEERITSAIEKFVWHGAYLETARPSFAQKIALARSMSMDHSASSMWTLIEKLNALRNKLAHSLSGEPRSKAMDALREASKREVDDPASEELTDNRFLLGSVISMSLGFVHRFEQEVERFKAYVNAMDQAINPHRHDAAKS